MSTNVNVSVALESLRRLSQAQVNANRRAKLLEDQRRRQARQALFAKARQDAAEGRNARGQFLYGIKTDRTSSDETAVAIYRSDVGTLNLAHSYFTVVSDDIAGPGRNATIRVATSGSPETDNLNASTAVFSFVFPTIGSLPSFTSVKTVYDGGTGVTTTEYNVAGDPPELERYIPVNLADPASVANADAELNSTYDFTITNYNYSVVTTLERRKQLALPAGPNTLIAVALCENAWSQNIIATTDTEHRELVYRETIPGFYVADVITTSTTTYAVHTTANNRAREAYAFVVGLNGTRQISVPTGLAEQLDRLWPPFALSYNNIGAPFYSSSIPDHPGNEAGGVSHYLLRSFGLGALNTTAHQFPCLTGTPAVFDYLADFPGGITLAASRSYSAMAEYLARRPSRYVAPSFSFGNGVASYLTAMPTATDVAVSTGNFRLYSKKMPSTINSSLSNRALTWDWNQPNYCRARLLELGFTTADLMP